jgi:hypothetical protein
MSSHVLFEHKRPVVVKLSRYPEKEHCTNAVKGHLLEALLIYYTAWIKAGRPEAGVTVDLGPMIPIAAGEHVCPPGSPDLITSAVTRSYIIECSGKVEAEAIQASGCTAEVVKVSSCYWAVIAKKKKKRLLYVLTVSFWQEGKNIASHIEPADVVQKGLLCAGGDPEEARLHPQPGMSHEGPITRFHF